jgi:glyoxylase-like metal-dependent hydrolase (beta-lactamase superfamily II)
LFDLPLLLQPRLPSFGCDPAHPAQHVRFSEGLTKVNSSLHDVDICDRSTPVNNASASQGAYAPRIVDLGNDVFEIDTQMGGYAGITAGYLIRGDRPALIETGTALSAPTVIAALAELGIDASDLATVVVTHIHLDHAGGVGDIASAYPGATVVVHERGARHLADPTRLVESARRVFGDDMDTLFGELLPTDPQRLMVIGDEGSIDLGGGRQLSAFHAPGHASHHLGLIDSHTGDLYTGDAAGVYIPETADVRPSTPPPDFDLDLALRSMQRFRDMQPQRLLFSHYGPVSDVDDVLERSAEELKVWVDVIRRDRDSGQDLDHAVAMLRERTAESMPSLADQPDVAHKFEVLSSSQANASGIWHYLEKSEPQ